MFTRRRFLQSVAGLTASAVVARPAWAQLAPPATQPAARDALGDLLPTRALGRSGEQVTILGIGGDHNQKLGEARAQQQIERAIELGVRFFDSAQAYGRGRSERFYGQFLTPRYRDQVFIMTKSGARDAEQARKHLDESLSNMNVDQMDLWQIHALRDAEDVDRRIENGVLDVFLEAKAKGRTRYIGFTGHNDYRSHVRMLERLAERGIELDTCQMPINVLDPHYESYVRNVLPTLHERGYGVLAMKTLAFGKLLGRNDVGWRKQGNAQPVVPEAVSLVEALGFAWSQPIATLISGTENSEQLEENCRIARDFKPMSPQEQDRILAATAAYAGPTMEFYKS